MVELGFVVGLFALIAVAAWTIYDAGKQNAQGRHAEDSLDAVDKANQVRRDVAGESDPVGRLRDKWRRSVPHKPADPDQ